MLIIWLQGAQLVAKTITADPGSYTLNGTDVTLTKTGAKILVADPGSYLLSGTDVTLTKGSNNKVLDATGTSGSGTYLLTGTAVSFIPVPPSAFPTRGEWPEKAKKKRRAREEARAESVIAARRARDALRESLARLYDGGEYTAPLEALEEAETEALATVNVITRLPELPLHELQVIEDLIRRIQELVRQRRLDEDRATAIATEIARIHLAESVDLAQALYHQTRRDYLARVILLLAE